MAQALIVIDIQEGLVKENPFDTKNFIINTKAIIQHFRDQNIEVIFIRHSEDEGLLAMGSDNWQVYHELKPQKNEKIFNKYYNSIFKDTELKEYLNRKNITDLTFVGMQVEFCIDTSVKVGFEYGYKITIVEDAISTFDNIHLSADQILSFYKEKIWRNRFAQLRTTKEILAIN
ncbi:cysteine hydrolase family protein [Veillonella sp.]|jgi:isochorismatase hydrolase|uniref:cysteine hydrolase family protein n=1 Tax=Veillonella TaxID=29465 RepID=UPI002905117A|nr:cysteine hydrolase family protein [Veillonella sp.]MDU1130346.1 cysteine hydrolase family protein [Veillonella sp.]MDU2868624.1 cysteine hydrolase family protein [Veillonella sp.]